MSSHVDPLPRRDPAGGDALIAAVRTVELTTTNEFERDYARSVPALVAWVRLRIAGLPHGRIDVEDIVQETWVRALEKFAGLPDTAGFRYWVLGIAQNVLLEAMRKDARGRGKRAPADALDLDQCPDSVTSISRAVARDDGFARLLEVILELPTEERQLVLLHGLEERPLANVAEQLRITEEAAGKRWQRLRARLREQPAFVSVWNE
jgi:RNA polymerase sigma-70 factor (ECF subfamily)